MRLLLAVLALTLVVSCGDVSSSRREAIGRSQSRLSTSLSVTSGVSGTVTTLAYYSAGVAHPGQNSVDIGASGGTAVYHQLDYLPSDVAGGWLRTYVVKESGYCSQWSPGSPYYNGAKLIVVTYLYATDGTYLGWHRAAYQHVSPNASVADAWFRWNNSNASVLAWASPDVDLGAQQSNGLSLGTVFAVWGNIYNGPSGGLCTTGSHLHQEGSGWRGGALFVGKGMTDRYNDVHLFDPIGGWPATGEPPWAPELYVAPAPAPVEEKPIEETPIAETPIAETPVGEAPTAGGAASEEKPPIASEASSDLYGGGLEGAEDAPPSEPPAQAGCAITPSTDRSGAFVVLGAVVVACRRRRRRCRE
jgi:hypothetical protein